MSEVKIVRLRLFGPLRDKVTASPFELSLPAEASIADLKSALGQLLNSPELIGRSAVGTESSVLVDSLPVPFGQELAILPPVSGG